MLTLNDFAEDLGGVCPESILFSAVPKPHVNFITNLVQKQTDEILKIFAAIMIGLVNQLMLRLFNQIYLSTCQKKKYQTLNY